MRCSRIADDALSRHQQPGKALRGRAGQRRRAQLVDAATIVATSTVASTETRAALARRRRGRALLPAAFVPAKKAFEAEWSKYFTVDVTLTLGREAGEFAERYRLRACDSVRLIPWTRKVVGRDWIEPNLRRRLRRGGQPTPCAQGKPQRARNTLISQYFSGSENSCDQICDHPSGQPPWRTVTEGDDAYNSNVTEPLTRDRIIELLRELPADATVDDAIETLVFLSKMERGIAELDAGLGVPHDEVKRRFDELISTGVMRPPLERRDAFEDWPDIRLRRGTAKRLIDEDRGDD